MRGKAPKPRWTADEDAQLRAGLSVPRHTPGAINARRHALGIAQKRAQPNRSWTSEEDALLAELRLIETQTEIGRRLGRTRSAVSQRLQKLGLVGDRTQADWARRGSDSPMWKGGSETYRMREFYGAEWRTKTRPQVLERDSYQCVVCGTSAKLQVHHVDPFRETHDHSIENQVTLCISHHHWAEASLDREVMKVALRTRDFAEVQALGGRVALL